MAAEGNHLENLQNVGSHSLRKGGISWLLNMVDGPGLPVVYLRANWHLGEADELCLPEVPGCDRGCDRKHTGQICSRWSGRG
eukprot:749216-Hanusia_phi.AAC.1